jgi:AraC-like DNA-binding protein
VATSVAHSISEYRAVVRDSFVPLKVTPHSSKEFQGIMRSAGADDVQLTDIRAMAHDVERTPRLIGDGDAPLVKVSLMLVGTCLLIQDGREAVLTPGDLAVYDTTRPYTLEFDKDFRSMVLMFPRHLLALPPDLIRELTAVRIAGTGGLGAVVTPFLSQLGTNLDQFAGSTGARLAHNALDLMTTVFIRELGLDDEPTDPHRALMRRICAYIDRHLDATDLSPATIASAHFISTRHLHGLFKEQGTTVSTWVRTRRLEQCRRDLINPALADYAVTVIAARWNFNDAAHFSRAFKAMYGVSPSEYRMRH